MSDQIPNQGRRRSLVFGEAADLYDRVRPGYPQQLVDDVLRFAQLDSSERILEVGAGTGKATALFAAQGHELLCLEPDPAMAAVARTNTVQYPDVHIFESSFEEWDDEHTRFGLLFSAQAWHWVEPEVRCVRAHSLLSDNGTLALFWHRPTRNDSELRRHLDHVYQSLAPGISAWGWGVTNIDENEKLAYGDELESSGLFADVTTAEYPWSQTYNRDQYIELLQTQSDHRMLSPDDRKRLLDQVSKVIEENGGQLKVDYVVHLFLARPIG